MPVLIKYCCHLYLADLVFGLEVVFMESEVDFAGFETVFAESDGIEAVFAGLEAVFERLAADFDVFESAVFHVLPVRRI